MAMKKFASLPTLSGLTLAGLMLAGGIPNALAASCVAPDCFTVQTLQNGGSFTSNGFNFSQFDFYTAMPATWEIHALQAGVASTGPYWSNAGFYLTAADGAAINVALTPGGSAFYSFGYRVQVPTSNTGVAVIFDTSNLAASGINQSGGRNTTAASLTQQIANLAGSSLAQNTLSLWDSATQSMQKESALGPFLASGLDIETRFSMTVDNSFFGDSTLAMGKIMETFNAKNVPEPATATLAALGLASFAALRRRR